MPTFGLQYTRSISDRVVASDRDQAGHAAIADGASFAHPVIVTDHTGARYEMVDVCEVCDQPIWSDQPHRDDDLGAAHETCPAPSSPLDTATTLDERPARGRR